MFLAILHFFYLPFLIGVWLMHKGKRTIATCLSRLTTIYVFDQKAWHLEAAKIWIVLFYIPRSRRHKRLFFPSNKEHPFIFQKNSLNEPFPSKSLTRITMIDGSIFDTVGQVCWGSDESLHYMRQSCHCRELLHPARSLPACQSFKRMKVFHSAKDHVETDFRILLAILSFCRLHSL